MISCAQVASASARRESRAGDQVEYEYSTRILGVQCGGTYSTGARVQAESKAVVRSTHYRARTGAVTTGRCQSSIDGMKRKRGNEHWYSLVVRVRVQQNRSRALVVYPLAYEHPGSTRTSKSTIECVLALSSALFRGAHGRGVCVTDRTWERVGRVGATVARDTRAAPAQVRVLVQSSCSTPTVGD